MRKIEKLRIDITEDMLTEKCWKLSSYILAEYNFVNLRHPINEYWCKFCNEFRWAFEERFLKELIELAGLIRALLDMHNLDTDYSETVGNLKYEDKEVVDLSYRESCNKIIHANSFSIELKESNSHPLDNGKNGYNKSDIETYKNPIIITEGVYYNKKWQSELDFIKFIDQTMRIHSWR